MCGYCIEKVMIEFLGQEKYYKAPVRENSSLAVLLESYAQETNFPMHSLKYAKAYEKESDILYVLHCRALEEIAMKPDSATKNSLSHNALIKHYHSYRHFASLRFKMVDLKKILPHPSWTLLYDPDFVFSTTKWAEFTSGQDLLAQCCSFLERYRSWWLKGEGQSKNDLQQRMRETGVLDPIEDIAMEEWDVFYCLFPALYFAQIYLSIYGDDLSPVKNIALTDVNGVPDFPGFDLWLQRKAFAWVTQARGTSFLLDNLDLEVRPLLIYYVFLKLEIVREAREQIIQRMLSLMKHAYEYDEFVDEVNKYIYKMKYYPGSRIQH